MDRVEKEIRWIRCFGVSVCLACLQACATVDTNTMIYDDSPNPGNGYRGYLQVILGFGESRSDMVRKAARACEGWGGLRLDSLRKISTEDMTGIVRFNDTFGMDFYEYYCNGFNRDAPSDAQIDNVPSQDELMRNEGSISEAKRKCVEIGFIDGTPEFSDCALKLLK
jgi:hypothetical protein